MNKLTTVLCLGAVVGMAGCGGSEKEASAPATLAPTASTVAPAPVDPAPTPAPAESSAAPLAALQPALVEFWRPVLAQAAAEEAPAGAKGLDQPNVAPLLAPGQTLEQTVTLQPGKCYTVIAIGLFPLSEVNVQILPTTPGFNTVFAQDQTTGPRAVLGKAPDCFKWALPVAGAVRIVTTAAAGQGPGGVATQVFEK